jgi:hypothetical protein
VALLATPVLAAQQGDHVKQKDPLYWNSDQHTKGAATSSTATAKKTAPVPVYSDVEIPF